MFEYIRGKISVCTPASAVIDIQGIGYFLKISLNTFQAIKGQPEAKLFTYWHMYEGGQALYGFFTEKERTLFLQLISISNIGPSTAQVILSSMTPEDVRQCILSENVGAFSKVKGIGEKTARRIIVELKDKLAKEGIEPQAGMEPSRNTLQEEALSALVSLGFNRIQVQKVLGQVMKNHSEVTQVEQVIKLALQQISG